MLQNMLIKYDKIWTSSTEQLEGNQAIQEVDVAPGRSRLGTKDDQSTPERWSRRIPKAAEDAEGIWRPEVSDVLDF